jgi:hypothetical protein
MCVKDYFVMLPRNATKESLENIKLSIPRALWTLIKLATLDRMSIFCYESNKVDFFVLYLHYRR